MENIIAVFRSRTDTMTFANILRSYFAPVNIVNTPRQINVSCGISARFDSQYLDIAQAVLARRQFDSFGGFYLMTELDGRIVYRRI